MSANYSLTFSNSNYVNNKKISNNVVKSKIISTLKKAEKVLTDEKFKKLQSDLIVNLKNNNIVVANIKNNNYKLDIIGGDVHFNEKSNPYKINPNPTDKSSYKIDPIIKSISHSNQKDESQGEIYKKNNLPIQKKNIPILSGKDLPIQSITRTAEQTSEEDTQSVISETGNAQHNLEKDNKPETSYTETVTPSDTQSITPSDTQSVTPSDTQSVTPSDTQSVISKTGNTLHNLEKDNKPETSYTETVQPNSHLNQKNELHSDSHSEIQSITSETGTDSPPVEKKKTIVNHIKGFFGFKGGNNNNDSNELSSDEESSTEESSTEELLDTQTYFFDEHDSDEESLLDKMKDKKYLNNLNVKDLRNISKTNNLILTKGGSYLKKEQLVKQIQKKFKNK
jgi:hypothetical protein